MINIKESASIKINQDINNLKKNGKKTTILSLGEAFFNLPDYGIKKIFKSGYHYSDSRGVPSLRSKLSNLYKSKYKVPVDPDNEIIISAGSKILTYMTFLLLLKKDDNVLSFDPSWLSYEDQIKLVGAKIKYIPINSDLDLLRKNITKKTKILIINNPNNPCGIFFEKNKLEKIYKICKEKKIYILSDEAYSDFIPKDEKFCSIGHFDKNKKNSIIINSISKNFGMSGWRIGYVISNKKIIKKLLILNQQLITCAPTLLQIYIDKYFNKILKNNKTEIQKILTKRRKINLFLKDNNFSFINAHSTFYIFLKTNKNNIKFSKKLITKYGISTVPGKFYGKNSGKYIRISIGVESFKKIIKSLKIIQKLI